jgi:hypothetical protein
MNATTRTSLLAAALLIGGCATLGGGNDIATLRAAAQGRYDAIQAANFVFDRLIAQPAPSNLTPKERAAWNAQTDWLVRTKTRLNAFSVDLKRVLDAPSPSGSSVDAMLASAQLAGDYARLGDDFAGLMKELTAESVEDEKRVAEAEGRSVAVSDSTRVDSLSRSGGIALGSPLKSRHDTANSTITTLT